MAKPLVSIITGVRNQNKYIQELLDSVASQKVKNFEHVVVEGESTDGTKEKIALYVKENKDKYPITVIYSPPKGISDAMNVGIQHAQGEWVIVVHGDDYLEDAGSTERMEKAIAENSTSSWLVGNYVRKFMGITFNTHTFLIRPLLYRLLTRGINLLSHQNMLMKRSLFETYGYYLADLKMHMDTEYYVRLLNEKVYPKAVDLSFTVFRRHMNSASMNVAEVLGGYVPIAEKLKAARKTIVWE